MEKPNPPIDPNSGFCSETKTFYSLRPPLHLPPETTPLSVASYAFSLQLTSRWPDSAALIDSATGQRVSYIEFAQRTRILAGTLQSVVGLCKGDTAFILSPNSMKIPILYFSLLSLGVVVSPANPASTESEISRQIELCKPVIAFATSAVAYKVPNTLRCQTVLIDSPEFDSMMTSPVRGVNSVEVSQSDLAAIMYSSGTTGKVKGVMLTHRNLIAIVATYHQHRVERESPAVVLYTVPYFHIFGFFCCAKAVAVSESVVVMERFDLGRMMRTVEEFKVTLLAVAPPIVVAMTKSDAAEGYDLRSLEAVGCGAAPLGKDTIAAFKARFAGVVLYQVRGKR